MVYHTSLLNPPYFAIFFRFFHPAQETFPFHRLFAFLTDFLLLFILSGLLLAWLKRFYSRIVGMKKTTKHRPFDRLILTVLWLIFPLRFLAESFTSGVRGGGGFLTHNAGIFFEKFLPIDTLSYPAWWAYSIALGTFFLLLPFSRYMHIPTEMVYIFLKNWGIRQGKEFTAFSKFQVYSCSRCGICIDQCQLGSSLNNKETQPVYFLKNIRHHGNYTESANNCLLCGRCEAACPVDLRLNELRISKREDHSYLTKDTYNYIPSPNPSTVKNARVAFFAGCMSHMTPGIIRAMQEIFAKSNTDYTFIDEEGGICCGRPMMLSGNRQAASVIIKKNKEAILASGAQLLVTSCPICYKTFREDYHLPIRVIHHSEYIRLLMEEKKLHPRQSDTTTVFHNPCELGRGSKVFDAPEFVLQNVSRVIPTAYDGRNSLCCGGSLANIHISPEQRTIISRDALNVYLSYSPEVLITACPLCKKTFSKVESHVPIKDLAEIVAENC